MTKEKKFFRRDGHISDLFTAICSDRLSEDKENLIPEAVRSHLENCEFCRNAVLDIYSSTLSPMKEPQSGLTLFSGHEPVKRSFSYRLFLRTAATFLVLAFITGIYLLMENDKPVNIRLAKKSAKIGSANLNKKSESNDLLYKKKSGINPVSETEIISQTVHDPFKDNPNLEYMVDSPHRGRLIHIISPEFKSLEKGKIVFKWENHIDKDLELKIMNNLNEPLYTFKAKGSKVEFIGNLSPGLYYWKLEDKENLYHVGKFLIEK